MSIGGWSFRTKYYSRNGEYKGTYVNLNTPIELYPTKIRYVDLETDICLRPNGKIQQIDREKLDKMVYENYIPKRLGKIVMEKAAEILNSLSLNTEKYD
jgi:protein associated with RNAse G/E